MNKPITSSKKREITAKREIILAKNNPYLQRVGAKYVEKSLNKKQNVRDM
ncbi:MAG: hypothetical protein AAFR61_23075 [Bacteroidota bacterium]